MRIGVNTGEAVVALGARPEQGEGIVTGDVVNTAARIEAGAPVDAILVGEQTYRATEQVIEYSESEPVVAKGKVARSGSGRWCRRVLASASTSSSDRQRRW